MPHHSSRAGDLLRLVYAVAASYVRRRGEAAPEALRDQAEIAQGIGDQETAAIWLEIADIAEEMLSSRQVVS